MYRIMLVVKRENSNPHYGMESIRSFYAAAEAKEEAEFLQEHLKIPYYVSIPSLDIDYPYITIAIQK